MFEPRDFCRARWCLSVPALGENMDARRPSYTTKYAGKSATNSGVSQPCAIIWYVPNLPCFAWVAALRVLNEESKTDRRRVLQLQRMDLAQARRGMEVECAPFQTKTWGTGPDREDLNLMKT